MLRIIRADERLAQPPKVNIALFGPSGVGKTTQARTLDPERTLFVDLEAGTLAVQEWGGDVLDIMAQAQALGAHPWEIARAIACLLRGPDPADAEGPYSRAAFDQYAAALAQPSAFAKYETIFVDSITVAGRMCLSWSQRQPEAFSEKTGKPDTRGAYGLHGREMVKWLTQLQHIPGRSIVVVGILDSIKDDFGRFTWEPQIDGSKASRELPGIFDQVITLQNFKTAEGQSYRAFVCQQQNEWGYPAKDRSGRLDVLEPPDLGALIKKMQAGKRIDATLTTSIPQPANNEGK